MPLENKPLIKYNISMKKFEAQYTKEAIEQFKELDENNQDKILEAVRIFEHIGTKYKNINSLGNGLFELKPKGVRAYFMYAQNKIIIIGLIVLKKTQKVPKRFIEQAIKNIENYKNKESKNDNK